MTYAIAFLLGGILALAWRPAEPDDSAMGYTHEGDEGWPEI